MTASPKSATYIVTYQLAYCSHQYVDLCAECADGDAHECGVLGPVSHGAHRGYCAGAAHGTDARANRADARAYHTATVAAARGSEPCAPEEAGFYACPTSSSATTTASVPRPTGGDLAVPVCAACARWIDSYHAARAAGLDDADAAERADADAADGDADPACGEHDFVPGPGGCRENPGIFALGGTTIASVATCECGAQRRDTYYGCQRAPGDVDHYTVTEVGDDPADSTRICSECDEPVGDCPCGDEDDADDADDADDEVVA